jgi:hypothetical protein
MFVQDQPTTSAPGSRPDPSQDRPAPSGDAPSGDAPSAGGRLLGLLRRLVDYGRGLVGALQQCPAAINPITILSQFGRADIALILARITRGLLLAAALEAVLIGRAAHPNAAPARTSNPVPRQPRAARPAA